MTAVIVVAAGSGQRLGAGVPKALVPIDGRTLLEHCVDAVRAMPRISQIVVVAPAQEVAAITAGTGPGVDVVAGGATRNASVRAGLQALAATRDVLIHDAARPFAPAEVFDRVLDALESAEAVVPALPVTDTIKRVHDGVVVETPVRAELVAVQTPQGFRVATLRAAHETGDSDVTDDAMLVERAGVPVHVVEGSPLAMKITTPFDLVVASAMRKDA